MGRKADLAKEPTVRLENIRGGCEPKHKPLSPAEHSVSEDCEHHARRAIPARDGPFAGTEYIYQEEAVVVT